MSTNALLAFADSGIIVPVQTLKGILPKFKIEERFSIIPPTKPVERFLLSTETKVTISFVASFIGGTKIVAHEGSFIIEAKQPEDLFSSKLYAKMDEEGKKKVQNRTKRIMETIVRSDLSSSRTSEDSEEVVEITDDEVAQYEKDLNNLTVQVRKLNRVYDIKGRVLLSSEEMEQMVSEDDLEYIKKQLAVLTKECMTKLRT